MESQALPMRCQQEAIHSLFSINSSSVDDWEVKQSSWSPTQVVLKQTEEMIRTKYSSSDSKVFPHVKLLCGGDLLESFAEPGLWDQDHVSLTDCFRFYHILMKIVKI